MKKTFILICLVIASFNLSAQWNGTDPNATTWRNGNVAIGHNLPTQRLDVIGRVKFRALGGESAGIWLTGNDGAGSVFLGQTGTSNTDPLGIYHGGTWRFTINQNGDIGLGLGTNPATQKLDIAGRIKFRATTAETAGVWFTDNGGTQSAFIGQTNFASSSPLGIYHGGTWRFAVDQNGYVGIGTNSPNGKLNIYNQQNFNANETATGQDHIILKAEDPGNGGYFGGVTWESGGRRRASIVATRENADTDFVGLAFFTQGTDGPGSFFESMRIARTGNVGIGTSEPDTKLTVKGTIHTHEVRVDAAANVVPDYVFEKDYNLLPLSEVETYVNQNKHLPEVPSAKEMEENGLNLKEMNLLLLKKVEELTLHLIEQHKNDQRQQAEIDQLKEENRSLQVKIDNILKN